MMLKNVVLPAPFGPMRLTIEPSGIVRSTSLTASRPPNRFVTRSHAAEVSILRAPARVRQVSDPGGPSARRPALESLDGLVGCPRIEGSVADSGDRTAQRIRPSGSRVALGSSGSACSSRLRRWLGNRPSGRNSIIATSATPYSRNWYWMKSMSLQDGDR